MKNTLKKSEKQMMAFKEQNMNKYHGQLKRFFKKKGRKEVHLTRHRGHRAD